MLNNIKKYMQKPKLYASSTAKFWDDEHISKGMLEAHLNPELESATRTLGFVEKSVEWISKVAPATEYPNLLDLGCGPGIYAELFDDVGYQVTGIDLSKRSIEYAHTSAAGKNKQIAYEVGSYLSMDYQGQFDVTTLIYCDFGVLSTDDRATLLQKIHTALRPNGCLIFDVFVPQQYEGIAESRDWSYEESGFWSPEPYLCLNSLYRYDDVNTFLRQHIIISEGKANCYNVWEHTFTRNELEKDLKSAGFNIDGFYGDVAGSDDSADSKQLCIVARKNS